MAETSRTVSKSVIFISYRRADSADVSGRIYDRLSDHFGRKAIFKDVDDIPLGVDFKIYLEDAVSRCEVELVIIGPEWLTITDETGQRRLDDPKDFVRIEVEAALKRGIPVVPVLIGGASMPTEHELPDVLEKLACHNGTAVRPDPDFRNDMNRLIQHLERHITPPSPWAPLAGLLWKAALALLAVVVLGVAAIGGFRLLPPPNGPIHTPVVNDVWQPTADPREVNPRDFPLPSDTGQMPSATTTVVESANSIGEEMGSIESGAEVSDDLGVIGQIVWRTDLVGDILQAPTVGPDGTVYVVTDAGMLVALDLDGNEQWSVVLGGVSTFVNYTSAVIAPDGRIYVVFNNELLTYAPDGTPGWTWRHSGEWLSSPPAFGPDGTAYLMSNRSSLWAISPQGVEMWGQALCQVYGGGTWPGPAVGADGTVYGVCKGQDIYALDPHTGNILWTYHTNDKMASTPAAGAGAAVYFASEGGWVFAMQPNGEPLWTTSVAGPAGMIKIVDAPIIVGPDGTVYVAPRHGVLYALNPVDGVIRWQSSVGGQGVGGYPVAAAADGSVYARNLNRELIRFSSDGAELWRVRPAIGERTTLSPPAMGPSGRLYIGIGRRLYAFEIDDL